VLIYNLLRAFFKKISRAKSRAEFFVLYLCIVFERVKKKIDDDIKSKEKTNANTTMTTSKDLVMDAATEGDGKKSGSKFVVAIGDHSNSGTDAAGRTDAQVGQEYFEREDLLGKYWDSSSGKLSFDMTNEGEIIDAYNRMLKTRDEMMAAGIKEEDNDFLRELNREITAMSENMPNLIKA
jgi:hypothetical protein